MAEVAASNERTKGSSPTKYKSGLTPFELAKRLATDPTEYGDPAAKAQADKRAADIVGKLALEQTKVEQARANARGTIQKSTVHAPDPIMEPLGKVADFVGKYSGVYWLLNRFDEWRWNRKWK